MTVNDPADTCKISEFFKFNKSRAFSIAITACAAKFCNRAICFVGEREYLAAVHGYQTKHDTFFAQGNRQDRANTGDFMLAPVFDAMLERRTRFAARHWALW